MSSAAALDLYLDNGWLNVFPLPLGQKFPPPKGVTGAAAETPNQQQIDQWKAVESNIGLRVPDTVIGIDIDAAGGKVGADTMRALVKRLGRLPKTWRSTARNDSISGIYFYRVPTGIAWASKAGIDVDIIQTGHRYAVVEPSLHPEGGRYRWLDADGNPSGIPAIELLPELPAAWIEHLASPVAVERHQCGGACDPYPQAFLIGEIDLTDPVQALADINRIIDQLKRNDG